MSLLNFQSALAYVIRSYDAQNTKNLDELSRTYELTTEEQLTLGNLINQQRLKAYSEELFLARWNIIREALEFLAPFVDLRAMSDLWEQDFEKKSTAVEYEDLVLSFMAYLAFDPAGSRFIRTGTKPFLLDLVKYTHAVFTLKHNVLPQVPRASHSLLTDRYFKVVTLEYDVREFFAELMELENFEDLNIKNPPRRDITLLFVASDEVTEFRSFEIDQELKNFLQAQLHGEMHAVMPSCYDDLVDVGICQSQGIERACYNKTH